GLTSLAVISHRPMQECRIARPARDDWLHITGVSTRELESCDYHFGCLYRRPTANVRHDIIGQHAIKLAVTDTDSQGPLWIRLSRGMHEPCAHGAMLRESPRPVSIGTGHTHDNELGPLT